MGRAALLGAARLCYLCHQREFSARDTRVGSFGMTIKRWLGALAGVVFVLSFGASAQAGATLDKVKQSGQISCGVPTGIAGFAAPDSQGRWAGFDIDI